MFIKTIITIDRYKIKRYEAYIKIGPRTYPKFEFG